MEFIQGFGANICATTICHPIDVIKVNYQSSQNGVLFNLKHIYKQRGIFGFYKGLSTNLMTYPIFWGAFFFTNSKLNKLSSEYKNYKNAPFLKTGVYIVAGNVASAVANPIFVIKTRLQIDGTNLGQTVRNIYNDGKYRAFYKGLSATMINNCKLGIQFPLYDYSKAMLHNYSLDFVAEHSTIAASFISKMTANCLFYPMDLIRVKQRSSCENLSLRQVVCNIYSGGFRAFYRGISLYNAVSIPQFVLMMYFIEIMKNY